MQCLNCGGPFEWAGQNARCMRCLSLFSAQNGQLTPIVVDAPGGGFNPQFNAIFAQNLGFGPPPPGAQPMPPPQQQQQHNLSQGTFDMGGGHQLQVKINGKTPEGYLKDKASSMIWGWIIGAIIIGVMVIVGVGFGIYIYVAAKDGGGGAAGGKGVGKWDGKSTLTCGGNDVVELTGITAKLGDTAIKAGGNCQISMTGVNITAPNGIEASASAKVSMTGGSITSTGTAVNASAAAQVTLVGTKVSGKVAKSGAAKITGAN